MNARAFLEVDKATYFEFLERQAEGRFEYDRGRIVPLMTEATFDRAQVVSDFNFVLRSLLSRRESVVSGQNRGVDTGNTVRYPDVLVEPAGNTGKGMSTSTPVLIVEVLRPSTAELDNNAKPAEYMSLPSLVTYVVASQDGPELLVWQRGADGGFPDQPMQCKGREQTLEIAALGIAIPLAEVYRGIGDT